MADRPAAYCANCGAEARGANYCPECGAQIRPPNTPPPQDGSHQQQQTPSPQRGDPQRQQPRKNQPPAQRRHQQQRQDNYRESSLDDTWFKMTAVLAAGYLIILILGFAVSPIPVGLSLLALIGSLVTMVVDLRQLPEQLADTPWYLWVIAAILLYIAAMPWYLYSRNNYENHPSVRPDAPGVK